MSKLKEFLAGILPPEFVSKLEAEDADVKALMPEARTMLSKIAQTDESFVKAIRDEANATALKSTLKDLKALGKNHFGLTEEDPDWATANKRVDTTLDFFGRKIGTLKQSQLTADDQRKEVDKMQQELMKANQTLSAKDAEIIATKAAAQAEIQNFKIGEALNASISKNKYAIDSKAVKAILKSEIAERGLNLTLTEDGNLSIKTKTGTEVSNSDKNRILQTADDLVMELTGNYIEKANPNPTNPNPTPQPIHKGSNSNALAAANANLAMLEAAARK